MESHFCVYGSVCLHTHLLHDVWLFECRDCAPIHFNIPGTLHPILLVMHNDSMNERRKTGNQNARLLAFHYDALKVLNNLGLFIVENYK